MSHEASSFLPKCFSCFQGRYRSEIYYTAFFDLYWSTLLKTACRNFAWIKSYEPLKIAFSGSCIPFAAAPAPSHDTFSTIFFKVLIVIGQWNLVCLFLMVMALWRFGFHLKFRKTIFFPRRRSLYDIFFRVSIVVGQGNSDLNTGLSKFVDNQIINKWPLVEYFSKVLRLTLSTSQSLLEV